MNPTVSQPNLFIAGAPKCGTTSMFDFLVEHQEVGYGVHKEPHFFNDDHEEFRHARALEDYLGFYSGRKNLGKKHIIDASTNYIYSTTAIGNILEFNDQARFILMFRNPMDLVVSLHAHFLFKQSEPINELENAWGLGPLRERAPDFVKNHPYPGHLSYQEAGQLGKYFRPILSQVPERQLLTVFFDDIKADPTGVIEIVSEFLGIQFSPDVQFAKSNRKQQVASGFLNRLLFYPPEPLRKLKTTLKAIVPRKLQQKVDVRALAGSKKSTERKLDPEFRSKMKEFFADDIQLLSQLTGRSLENWN